MRFRIILSLLSLDERIEAAGEEEQEAIRLSDIANDHISLWRRRAEKKVKELESELDSLKADSKNLEKEEADAPKEIGESRRQHLHYVEDELEENKLG
ncbi:hypothetical protein V3481_017493 [Fusarium oxysporum f. sp. vasinfectum]|uniref:Uncharacterized protein n=1 Tax=Fusarium oxysporum f. sp. vasinfectum 25433 TaxID=1089449 RepID=X0KUY3_FUSOX|nr:hypothetical protein FOTG_14403 [Fusarium oxysporum f. sp. vasinfectum 25433]